MPGMMSSKEILGSIIRAIARAPVVRTLFYHPAVRRRIQVWPGFRRFYGSGWELRHPFDREYHTDTSGFVPSDRLESSPHDSKKRNIYAGSQPSIIRLALNTLPALPECTFIDLGCGKGRPLLVASEYPFRSVIGVELSPSLVLDARKNAATLSFRGGHLSRSNNTMPANFRCPRETPSFSSTTLLGKKSLRE